MKAKLYNPFNLSSIDFGKLLGLLVLIITIAATIISISHPLKKGIPVAYDLPNKPEGLTNTGSGPCKRVGNTYCDGQRMYQLYMWYKNQKGWWNTNSELTPPKFLAMMLMAEATSGDAQYLKAITKASASQLWGSSTYHKAYCTDASCESGIFNFIGAYMQSAGVRYNSLTSSPSPTTLNGLTAKGYADYFVANGLTLDQIAKDAIYSPVSTVYTNDTPTEWGTGGCGANCNILGLDWVGKALSDPDLKTNTTNRCGIYDVVPGSTAVVYTINQQYNWSLPDTPCD